MVRGRPVRNCTKATILYSIPKRDSKSINGASNKLESNARSITDYFQTVNIDEKKLNGDILEDPILKRKTRRNVNCLSDAQITIPEKNILLESVKEQELITADVKSESPVVKKVVDMTLNGIKSPPTPHRITLCTETTEEKSNGKAEVKNFQKPTVAPKARRKLNNLRLHMLDEPVIGNNHKLTDYFPVRRSVRKTKTTVLEEKQRILEKALRSNLEDGLKICYFGEKGRGIVADKHFCKGDFVVEYSGDLIDIAEAKKREEMYALDQNTGCYMYYFKHNNQQYCIDATPESNRLGRLVNHSRNGNLQTRTISVDGKPRLVLIAKEDIQVGEELLYDYGDRSKESLKHHPWLAN